jgi:hypothetical protein
MSRHRLPATLTQIAPRLEKLLLMLSSDRDGEVVNAARAIGHALQGVGADWHDLAAGLLVPTKKAKAQRNGSSDQPWRDVAAFCVEHSDLLRQREREFVTNIACHWRGDLTEPQRAWLHALYERLQKQAA